MPTNLLKHLVIPCGIGIVLFIGLLHTQPIVGPIPKAPLTTEKQIVSRPIGNRYPTELEWLRAFQNSDFYRTIIDNNLFRPLGWTPPRPQEPYRLLGTLIPTDARTPPKAIIQNTVGNQTYIVTIGDTLDLDTTVTDIQPKQVTLEKAGQKPRILNLNPTPWIK